MRIRRLSSLSRASIATMAIFAMLFLACMNFAQKCYYFIYAAFIITMLWRYKRLKADGNTALLLLFSISYLIFYGEVRSSGMVMLKQFAYLMCYIIGFNLIPRVLEGETTEREALLKRALIVPAMGAFAHYLLNMFTNLGRDVGRNTIDVWSGSAMSATGQAAMAVIALGIFTSLLFTESSLKRRAVALGCLALIWAYNLVLAGRTLVLLSAAVLLIGFLYTQRMYGKAMNRRNMLMILGFVGFAILLFSNDIFGIRTLSTESGLFARLEQLGAMDNVRLEFKLAYLKSAFRYPFGGGRLKGLYGFYAHELYLDTYSDAGIIGWFFLVVFVIRSVICDLKLLKSAQWSIMCKNMVLCTNVCMHVIFFVEPILSGMPWLFCIFCFYQGLYSREYRYLIEEQG